ncbi:MAG: FtsQ-type POTRA domain-containing protein [Oscillospiraceae bacterium]|nr:FtsQ-type POTRA domain-containing protein [Oscillospiraceae bacterium]
MSDDIKSVDKKEKNIIENKEENIIDKNAENAGKSSENGENKQKKQEYNFVNVSDEPNDIPEAKIRGEGKNSFVLFCLLFAILTALLFTPAFNIRAVTVTGNSALTAEQIVKSSGITTGRNILRVNSNAAEKSLEKIPMIKNADILLKFPSTVEIAVEECARAAYIKYMDKYICIDKNGKILEVAKTADNANLIIVTGVSPKEFIAGKSLVLKDADKLEALKSLLSEIEEAVYLPNAVKSIDLSDKNKITMVMDNEIIVNMGKNESLQYKMAYLTKTLETQLKTYRGGTLDLSDPSSAARYKGSAQ